MSVDDILVDNEGEPDFEREPDFTDQTFLEDPTVAPGATGSSPDDPASDGEEVYIPPTDPVVTTDLHGQAQILGGFATSSTDSVEVQRSSDGELGDEAIAETVQRELREDAATTDLQIAVEVNQGVVYLRGTVGDLDDVDNAESVAARVPGVVEVREMLEVPAL
jgi:hypothetical protein